MQIFIHIIDLNSKITLEVEGTDIIESFLDKVWRECSSHHMRLPMINGMLCGLRLVRDRDELVLSDLNAPLTTLNFVKDDELRGKLIYDGSDNPLYNKILFKNRNQKQAAEYIATMENEIADDDLQITDMQRQNADMHRQNAELQQEIADDDSQITDMQREIADMHRQNADLQQEIAGYKNIDTRRLSDRQEVSPPNPAFQFDRFRQGGGSKRMKRRKRKRKKVSTRNRTRKKR